jgi:hypothetical protein
MCAVLCIRSLVNDAIRNPDFFASAGKIIANNDSVSVWRERSWPDLIQSPRIRKG